MTPIYKRADPRAQEMFALLNEHQQAMAALCADASNHALTENDFQRSDLRFWGAYEQDGSLLGCAGLKILTHSHYELKSMRTAAAFLGQGVAKGLLNHLIGIAAGEGAVALSLETGHSAEFAPAIALYKKLGFSDCAAFADYPEDPESYFMTLKL